tara:strand:- start:545 stop:850 length:306 start_codon:yes stop_codon:yes gene_type:complete
MNIKYSLYWDFIKIGFYGILVFLLVGMFLSIPLCLLWNWLMPHIFGLPAISVLEAFGLSALITMLTPRQIKLNKDNKNLNSTDVEKQLEEVFENITSQFKA